MGRWRGHETVAGRVILRLHVQLVIQLMELKRLVVLECARVHLLDRNVLLGRSSVEDLGNHCKLLVLVLRWRKVRVVLASDASDPLLKGLFLFSREHVRQLLTVHARKLIVPLCGPVGDVSAWLVQVLLLVHS